MSVFVDGIKSEAEALGIETLTPAELEVMYAQIH
jgi:ethanolamine utilization microcompartment shell protein EutS